MGLTGKYDFPGIKKWGARGILLALQSVPYIGPALKISIIYNMADAALKLAVNWFANNGLIVLNVGAITVEGEWDQKAFDKAMDDAWKKVELPGPLTDAQKKAIDDEVIKAARRFIIFTPHN
jgi:hypothetical protein